MRTVACVVVAVLAAFLACVRGACGQSITYQGRLDEGGAAVNGAYDLEFRFFTTAAGSAQVGAAVEQSVDVVDGLFHATISVPDVFNGDPRWLQVRARRTTFPPGAGGWVTLNPRQLVTPAPLAIKALTDSFTRLADVLTNAAGTTRLFINRSTPVIANEVFGVTIPGSLTGGGVAINHGSVTGTPALALAAAGSPVATLTARPNGGPVAQPNLDITIAQAAAPVVRVAAGGVGVNLTGSTQPAYPLEVNGDAAANSFTYRSSQSRTLTIPPEAFHAENTGTSGVFGGSSGTAFLGSGAGSMVAPLYLPDDAVIAQVTVYYIDNAAADLTATLYSRAPIDTASTAHFTATTSGASALVRGETVMVSAVYDTSRAWHVRVFSSNWNAANTCIKAVQVSYRVGKAD